MNTHPPTVVSSDFTVYSCHFLFIPKNNNAAHVPLILSLTNFCSKRIILHMNKDFNIPNTWLSIGLCILKCARFTDP